MTRNNDLGCANPQEVKAFLEELKLGILDREILFLDERLYNTQVLFDLEITAVQRLEIIRGLSASHFCRGPEDLDGLKDIWVFGHEIKKKEVCIKVSLGTENAGVICISFYIAEHPMKYAFKK